MKAQHRRTEELWIAIWQEEVRVARPVGSDGSAAGVEGLGVGSAATRELTDLLYILTCRWWHFSFVFVEVFGGVDMLRLGGMEEFCGKEKGIKNINARHFQHLYATSLWGRTRKRVCPA